ncbi:MAG: MipA/OmpV family protein [Magnetospirillum gryphiswaldense]|nr:MipA/OmpV family protein [Magnetospirillum gryphiswaldense]
MKTTLRFAFPSVSGVAAASLLLVLSTSAQAQNVQGHRQIASSQYSPAQQAPTAPVGPPSPEAGKKDWNIRLGAGAIYQPEYEGSDEYKIAPLPMVLISYRDLVFLRGPMLGANVFTWTGAGPNDKLQVGPLVRYQFGRDEDDSDDLRGMGDVDAAVELGGFVTYSTGPWSAGLTLFRDVSNSHDGLTAKLSAGNRLPLAPKLMLRSEIATTWADDNYNEAFFGVSAQQSARSGLARYQAQGGFKDAGITFDLDYSLTEHWGMTGRLGYKRLLGDAADAPLVADRGSADQLSTGLFFSYKF